MAALRSAGARARPRGAALEGWIVFYGAAIALFAAHGIFHVWEWLAWPPPDALQAVYGASELGRVVHAVTEVIVALALLLAFWEHHRGTIAPIP